MYKDDIELIPRTYSVKSYKAKNTLGLKKIIKILLISSSVIFVLFIIALTLFDMA
mgnify:CR=1 FL=1